MSDSLLAAKVDFRFDHHDEFTANPLLILWANRLPSIFTNLCPHCTDKSDKAKKLSGQTFTSIFNGFITFMQ